MQTIPRFSVITPSFNQAQFLERTILSVLNQGYPNLEYIIIDGGSTDGSLDIINKYSDHLAYWVSESDLGQSHAINKGLSQASGDWICWQNSDDIFYPSAFDNVLRAIQSKPFLDLIIGNINIIDEHDHVVRQQLYVQPTYNALLAEGMVLSNQAAFWRATIHKEIGYFNENLDYGFDYEWFLRCLKHVKHTYHIPKILGALRLHNLTKTSLNQIKFSEDYAEIRKNHPTITYKNFYLIRRFFLTLLNLEIKYLIKGLLRRLKS